MLSRIHLLSLLSTMLIVSAVSAAPAATIDATNPEQLVNLVRGFGSGTLEKQTDGAPMIQGRIDGNSYAILFLDCTSGENCRTVQFYSSWDVTNVSDGAINDWNKTKRFIKAYLSDNRHPFIEMDVNLYKGVTSDNFEDTIDWWKTMMESFKKDVIDSAE